MNKPIKWTAAASFNMVQYEDGTGDLEFAVYANQAGVRISGNGSTQAPLRVDAAQGFTHEPRKIAFEVVSLAGGPLHPDQAHLYVTCGRYNMAVCDQSGAIIRTFVPATSLVADIMAELGKWYAVKDLMGYEPDPRDLQASNPTPWLSPDELEAVRRDLAQPGRREMGS